MVRHPRRVFPHIGSAIRSRREAVGLTQEQLAARAEIALRTLTRAEGGHLQPTVRVLVAIAGALGTTVDALLIQPDDPEQEAAS